jgi:hypothetical protein
MMARCQRLDFWNDPMRRFAFKALFTALTLNKFDKKRPDWDRIVLIFATAVTFCMVALYLFEKFGGH